MDNGWATATIESLLKAGVIVGHKDGNHGSEYPRVEEFGSVGVPFLTAKSLRDGKIDIDNAPRLADARANRLRFGFLEPGDVLLSHNATVGRVAIVPKFSGRLLIGTSLTYFRVNPQKLSARYLAAYFAGRDFQDQLAAVMSFSTRNQVPITLQRCLTVVVPPLPEQRAIASVLGALDDKIELNRRMNETLEALAQSIFKSWFVDGTQAGLPKGWRETTLGELAAISGGKQLPTKECKQSGKFPVFGANGIMGFGERATHEDFVIAFGRVGAYCGSIHWAYDGAWINNNASSVGPHCWPEFVLQAMLNVDFEAMRTGSAQPFIPNSALAAAKIIRPVDDVLDSYCAIARPLRLKQTRNEAESRTLAALRDALLPKLLNGELRVTAAVKLPGILA